MTRRCVRDTTVLVGLGGILIGGCMTKGATASRSPEAQEVAADAPSAPLGSKGSSDAEAEPATRPSSAEPGRDDSRDAPPQAQARLSRDQPEPLLTIKELTARYTSANGNPSELVPVESELVRYLDAHPDDPSALRLLSNVNLELGRVDESLAMAIRCTEVLATAADCWLTIAVIQETRRSKAQAVEGYRRYLMLKPDGRYAPDARRALERLKR